MLKCWVSRELERAERAKRMDAWRGEEVEKGWDWWGREGRGLGKGRRGGIVSVLSSRWMVGSRVMKTGMGM